MALLDALLLDPHPLDVWIAYRNDGIKGTGTLNDPYDGSSDTKFDGIMAGLPANLFLSASIWARARAPLPSRPRASGRSLAEQWVTPFRLFSCVPRGGTVDFPK